jgi:hypothetical protein
MEQYVVSCKDEKETREHCVDSLYHCTNYMYTRDKHGCLLEVHVQLTVNVLLAPRLKSVQ